MDPIRAQYLSGTYRTAIKEAQRKPRVERESVNLKVVEVAAPIFTNTHDDKWFCYLFSH